MNPECKSLHFTTTEKIVAAIPFSTSIIIGAYGLWQISWMLTVAYLFFAYGGILLMMRYTICPRCPHLLEGNDCLNLPPAIAKKIIASNRKGTLNFHENLLHKMVKYGILLIPIYWLMPNFYLLIPFVVTYFVGQAIFTFYFCKHCKNTYCFQNKNSEV